MIIDGVVSDSTVRQEFSRYFRLMLALFLAVVYSAYRKMKLANSDHQVVDHNRPLPSRTSLQVRRGSSV